MRRDCDGNTDTMRKRFAIGSMVGLLMPAMTSRLIRRVLGEGTWL